MGQAAEVAQQPAQPLVLHLSVTTCAVLQRLQLQGTAVYPVPDQGHWVLDFGKFLLSMHHLVLKRPSPTCLLCGIQARPTSVMCPPCWVQSCLWACLRQPGSGLSPQLQALAKVHK